MAIGKKDKKHKKPPVRERDVEANEVPPEPPVELSAALIEKFPELKKIEGKELKNGNTEVAFEDFRQVMLADPSAKFLSDLKDDQKNAQIAAKKHKGKAPKKDESSSAVFWEAPEGETSVMAAAEKYKNLVRDNFNNPERAEAVKEAREELNAAIKAGLGRMESVPKDVDADKMAEVLAFTLDNQAGTELGEMLQAQKMKAAAKAAAAGAEASTADAGDAEGGPSTIPMKPKPPHGRGGSGGGRRAA